MCALHRSLFRCAFLVVGFGGRLVIGGEIPDSKDPVAAPTEFVQTALQAELKHDSAARTNALARALAAVPHDPAAHWHSGEIRVGDEWLPVEKAEERAAADPRLIEYRKLRESDAGSLDSQIALARWCRKQNLKVQEEFHWAAVMQLSPRNKEAQTRLGLQEFRGLYLTRDQIESYKKQLDTAEAAMKKWKPHAQQWRIAFSSRDDAIRKAALNELTSLRDLEAIPALEEVLVPASIDAELAVVGILSRIEDQIATDFLIRHAVLSEDPQVREAAAKALKPRSLFAYVPTLMAAIKAPAEYSYFADILQAEGPTQIVEIGSVLPTPLVYSRRRPLWDVRRLQQIVEKKTEAARVRVAEKVNQMNAESEALNQRIYPALSLATGQQLPNKPQAWWEWWQKRNELQSSYDQAPKQTIRIQNQHSRIIVMSCFLPGTKVWLDSGPIAIEKVRIGDRVLSQDPDTGELDYRFVVDTTIRPPSPTLRIGLPKEEIAATLGHPIWVVGKGWRMAKEIVVGDYLHGVHGGVPVEFVEKGPESNAYNLVVAGFNTYCIGDHRILVHDNLARKPSQTLLPGFDPREVVAAK